MPGVAIKAARAIDRRWPHIRVVGTYSPPYGFEDDPQECETILENLTTAQPEVVLLGVGAPKQELWAHRFRDRLPAKTLLCVGATIDFLAGEKNAGTCLDASRWSGMAPPRGNRTKATGGALCP